MNHIPSGLQTSASCLEVQYTSLKGEIFEMQNGCCYKPKLTKLCWPGPRETAWTSLDMQALSKNICARLCLGVQWPLRKWIYLCARGKGEELQGPTVCREGAWHHLLFWPGNFSIDYNKIMCPCFICRPIIVLHLALVMNSYVHEWQQGRRV